MKLATEVSDLRLRGRGGVALRGVLGAVCGLVGAGSLRRAAAAGPILIA